MCGGARILGMELAVTDEELKDRAFDQYRIQHGIPDSRRLGDMPLQVISDILRAAQKLKSQEQSR